MSEKIKLKQGVSVTEFREVLEDYEAVTYEVHVKISLAWDKVCKADIVDSIQKVV